MTSSSFLLLFTLFTFSCIWFSTSLFNLSILISHLRSMYVVYVDLFSQGSWFTVNSVHQHQLHEAAVRQTDRQAHNSFLSGSGVYAKILLSVRIYCTLRRRTLGDSGCTWELPKGQPQALRLKVFSKLAPAVSVGADHVTRHCSARASPLKQTAV